MKIKISFVITDLSVGGAQMMLFKLLSRLDRSRFEPEVISLIDAGPLAGAPALSWISRCRASACGRGSPIRAVCCG